MAIFNSYVKLPEGIYIHTRVYIAYMCIIFRVSFPLELSPYLVEYLAVLYIE